MFMNSTYVNGIFFSDLLITVWFGVSVFILHSTESFSDNIIFSYFFRKLIRIDSIVSIGQLFQPFQSVNSLCGSYSFRCI